MYLIALIPMNKSTSRFRNGAHKLCLEKDKKKCCKKYKKGKRCKDCPKR